MQFCATGENAWGRVSDKGAPEDFDALLRAELDGPEQRLATLNSALERLGTRHHEAVPLLIEAGRCYARKRDRTRQRDYARRAFECATASGDAGALVESGAALAVASCWTGARHVARSHADRVGEHLVSLPDPELGEWLNELADIAWVELQLQRSIGAEALLRRGLRVAEHRRRRDMTDRYRLMLATALGEAGRLPEARSEVEQVRMSAERDGDEVTHGRALLALASIALDAGDGPGARDLVGRAWAEGRTLDHDSRACVLLGLAMIYTGQPQDGRDLVVEAAGGRLLPLVSVAKRTKIYVGLAFAEAAQSREADAQRWADLAMRATWARGVDAARAYALLARAQATVRSDPAQAAAAAETSLSLFDQERAELGRGAASLLLGQAWERLGRRAEAARILSRAETLYRRAGADIAAERIGLVRARRSETADAGGGDAPGETLECLSPREVEVARLVAQGQTNRKIAATLRITTNTVQVHVSRILRKLDVPSRVAVARLMTLAESGSVDMGEVDAAVATS